MKNLLFLLIPMISLAQYPEDNIKSNPKFHANFQFDEDSKLIYQNIFTNDSIITVSDIYNFLNKKSNLKNLIKGENSLSGEIFDMVVDYKKYGGTYMNSLILLNHKMSGNFIIELKDNRYRLTIKNIKFLDDFSLYSINTYKESDNLTYLEEMVVNKKKVAIKNTRTILQGLQYLDSHFTDFFKHRSVSNDW